MQTMRRYGRIYAAVIVCFALAALGAAGMAENFRAVNGTGSSRMVVLDPGHGGEDGGAVSVTGAKESEINLALSLRVRDLMRLCAIETRMTRDGDYAIYDDGCETLSQKKVSDLKNRAAQMAQLPGALLLSIHQNTFPDAKYHGAQVFYNGTAESRVLAEAMRAALCAGLDGGNRRETKPASGVYLMEQVENPAVLIECGFLSNREEEVRLRDEAYQKRLACCICAGTLDFLNDRERI